MNRTFSRILSLVLVCFLLVSQTLATCGGGGGGGRGGITPANGEEAAYRVPWKIMKATDPIANDGLTVYWFPSSVDEARRSSLLSSRQLTLYSSQCVSMVIADSGFTAVQNLLNNAKLPTVIIVDSKGNIVNRMENKNGNLAVDQIEKFLENEMKQRESTVDQQLKSGREKAKGGDSQGAIASLRGVYDQRCMFPNKAKDAAKELKKLGVNDVSEVHDAPNMEKAFSRKIEAVMQAGLNAEIKDNYAVAEKLYSQAVAMDPNDPVPPRFLGELYRHEIGDWEKSKQIFQTILDMPADPLSRAVALHGIGKMTIHEGNFAKGLAMMEESVKVYPLALTYRNLAVYWNSEGDRKKADYYTQQALALDPKDPFNLVFAAAFMAGSGKGDEALKIARENKSLMPASYNLAAIYAQTGDKASALALLRRHFFTYERTASVRSKEMMEARVDYVFASLMKDKEFLELTKEADGKLPMVHH